MLRPISFTNGRMAAIISSNDPGTNCCAPLLSAFGIRMDLDHQPIAPDSHGGADEGRIGGIPGCQLLVSIGAKFIIVIGVWLI